MKIAVNTRLLIKDRLEGIGWFTYETLKRITKTHSEHEFVFFFDRKFNDEFIFEDNVTPVVIPPQSRHPFLWYLWFEHSIPSALKKYNPDVFLSPDGYLSLSAKVPSIPVIHDINFAHRPKDLPFIVRNYLNYYFPKFAQKATRIATVSEYSKQDISNTYKVNSEKIDVVYNGVNSIYSPVDEATKQKIKEEFTEGKDFFVFIGALNPRKNVARLMEAFDEFKKSSGSDFKLVIVGGEMFKNPNIEAIYNKMTFAKDVIFTGRMAAEKLKFVLGAAYALSFVPVFEGFGIPIVEAFASDVPVITSNVTSMPEVSGDAALLVDPYSVDSIKLAMLSLYNDANLRNSLIEKGRIRQKNFSWDLTAERLWNSIEKCVKK